jgi:hypothetical protein
MKKHPKGTESSDRQAQIANPIPDDVPGCHMFLLLPFDSFKTTDRKSTDWLHHISLRSLAANRFQPQLLGR